MPIAFTAGDQVQTPFGKGVVRDVRNNGRVMVDVGGRALVLVASQLTPAAAAKSHPAKLTRPEAAAPATAGGGESEVDLHGLTVEEALVRIDEELNAALLRGDARIRFIHGRSGGRLRGALHARLRAIPSVRAFAVDPRNAGVTLVTL